MKHLILKQRCKASAYKGMHYDGQKWAVSFNKTINGEWCDYLEMYFDDKPTIIEIRAAIEAYNKNITDITDKEATTYPEAITPWENFMGQKVVAGQVVRYGDNVYRVVQEHTVQETWTPDITPALYNVIDVQHEGTIDDPIPFVMPMELFEGKYYTEDNVLYLCIRNSEMALSFHLADLVGNYVEIVNAD